jgi:hypothetical protein
MDCSINLMIKYVVFNCAFVININMTIINLTVL